MPSPWPSPHPVLVAYFAWNFGQWSKGDIMADNDKIMGIIARDKYVKTTYTLLMVATAGGLLLALLGLIGILLPLGIIFNLLGFAGLILALVGVFLYKGEFSSLDQSHLIYIAILFAAFFILMIIVNAGFYTSLILMMLVTVLVDAAYLLFLFTGFNSWKHGRTITKDNIKAEVQLALKRA